MFRASIQRQGRLSHVARRFPTVVVTRNARPESLPIIRQALSSQPALQHSVPRHALFRLYSSQSAAAQANREGEFAPVPSAPVTRFSELSQLGVNERLVQALTQGMGYDAMTEVQSMAINPALKGTDMVAQAKTGTGKTLAFLIPLFQRVLMDQPQLADPRARRRSSSEDIRAIILSPTRELAEQIGVEARKLARNTGIVVQTAVGGTRKRESLFKMWREGCDVLVATPGRLNDLLSDPSAKVSAPRLQAFVLDEADRMLDVGFSDEIREIQRSLPSRDEVERQTLLFSATIPRDVVHLAKSMVRPDNFEFVQTIKADESPTHERVPQHLVTVNGLENIFPTILEIAHRARTAEDSELPFKAIVFFSNTASVQFAHEVFRQIRSISRGSGIQIFEIHSKLTQGQRTRSADYFRRAKSAILFSSDVTARGMDFPNVTDVIQVGLPPDREQYIHRLGRTGRAGNAGKGWLILSESEIPEARSRLPGLPIKPHDALDSPRQQVAEASASENGSSFFTEVATAYSSVSKSHFRALYLANLGQKFGRYLAAEDIVSLMNQWCQYMGWSEPPAISPKVAQNRGLTRTRGVRIGYDPEEAEELVSRIQSRGPFRTREQFQPRDKFHSRGRTNPTFGRNRDNNFKGRGRSDPPSFESRFASRASGQSNYNRRASF
ncbi:hypothetical protein O1611_g5164 [Lasiodiplodia mahajangana]|uniref:Uncharacterized protein n=1 Tax=Lasiodiplodia mahajangana TaxID=1108764 RepID=A0ACC2JM34_9PEZI|nr:hypothetical protein O1611_g5164 [Lasiodiplodia mahajangana]